MYFMHNFDNSRILTPINMCECSPERSFNALMHARLHNPTPAPPNPTNSTSEDKMYQYPPLVLFLDFFFPSTLDNVPEDWLLAGVNARMDSILGAVFIASAL